MIFHRSVLLPNCLHQLFRIRIHQVAQIVSDDIEPEHDHHDDDARKGSNPPGLGDVNLAIEENTPPTGRGGLNPQTQKAERRFEDDDPSDIQGSDDHHRRKDIRKDMTSQDTTDGATDPSGSLDEFLFSDGKHLPPHHPGISDPTRDTADEDDVLKLRTRDGHNKYREQNGWKGKLNVHHLGDDAIRLSSEIAGDEPQGSSDEGPEKGGHQSNGKGDP